MPERASVVGVGEFRSGPPFARKYRIANLRKFSAWLARVPGSVLSGLPGPQAPPQ